MVEEARRQAQAAGVDDRVHLVGRLDDPEPVFRAADLFALPSAYESFGLVVLEALAYGLPVLATPVGVVPDVVVDGVNGYVVEDPSEIQEALTRFARTPRGDLAEAARASAQEHNWSRVADSYLQLLEELGAHFPQTAATATT
jgi:UDP-glucose:(heptosyl)LPS alpha-1,3-glucosyltransferase